VAGGIEETAMPTRREVLKQAGMVAALATTAPWWLVRRAHAQRREKLIVWSSIALAPQVDRILKEQCYAYAKQAGIKENEIQYVELGTGQILPKTVAALEAGNPPDVARYGSAQASLYRSQGHLLEVTDIVEKMQQVPGGLFPVCLEAAYHKGKAYGVPYQVSPRPLVTRLDLLAAAKVDPPKTWDELIEVSKKLQQPPKLTGFGICLGLTTDADNDIMNVIWSYGGKLVEADDKTVALKSSGTVQAYK
jgi:multiple sugar transport system substrate-binding protein